MKDKPSKPFLVGIVANNVKIIELYNKIKSETLDPSPDFQRKLVWKRPHKIKFIETVLMNFPFPEIYIAPKSIDTKALTMSEYIVDGQQRLTTIKNYIEDKDVFALGKLSIPKFSELTPSKREDFLQYKVSVRNLENATKDQIKDIFERINNTDYALNNVERLNARWGDSEFICFAKQIVEEELDISEDVISYIVEKKNRQYFLEFFHTKYRIFTGSDNSRMLSLQYILTLLATICEEKYFRRNDLTQNYIEHYYEEFRFASEIESNLIIVLKFIDSLKLDKKSYWFNKANIFNLICELYKYDISKIKKDQFKAQLKDFEELYRKYLIAELDNVTGKAITKDKFVIHEEDIKYFDYAREAVNEKVAREYRGDKIENMIVSSF